jgi:hypothetical protein
LWGRARRSECRDHWLSLWGEGNCYRV